MQDNIRLREWSEKNDAKDGFEQKKGLPSADLRIQKKIIHASDHSIKTCYEENSQPQSMTKMSLSVD